MIQAKNLVKRYGANTALHGVSFTFEDGRIYGFLGPNGAGKSTTMNIITGCLAPDEGEVTINGHDIFDDAIAAKRCIGYLPEQPPVYLDMTVFEYLCYVGEAKGLKRAELLENVDESMKRTSLESVQDRLIGNLSKGYRQRVGIAQAILGNPPIVILDEPTVGLDPRQIIEIRSLIRELGESHTVIISSHILSEIEEICDYTVIISSGSVVAADAIENLRTMFEGSAKIRLEARCTPTQAEEIFAQIEDLRSLKISQKGAGVVCAEVETPKNSDIRDRIFFAFADARLPIIAMNYEEASLERVFLSLTETTSETSDENEANVEDEGTDDGDYTPMFGASEDTSEIDASSDAQEVQNDGGND